MKWYIRYESRPRCSSLVHQRAGRTGEQPAEGTQEHRHTAADQVQVPAGVVVQPAQNVGVDLALGHHPQRQAGQSRIPRVVFEEPAEIDVEEMPSRAQHPHHFGEEAVEVRVGVRGLDVEHRVEGLIGERQALGVAVHEIQSRQVVPVFGEFDAVGVEVQPGVGGRVQRLHQDTRLRRRGRSWAPAPSCRRDRPGSPCGGRAGCSIGWAHPQAPAADPSADPLRSPS